MSYSTVARYNCIGVYYYWMGNVSIFVCASICCCSISLYYITVYNPSMTWQYINLYTCTTHASLYVKLKQNPLLTPEVWRCEIRAALFPRSSSLFQLSLRTSDKQCTEIPSEVNSTIYRLILSFTTTLMWKGDVYFIRIRVLCLLSGEIRNAYELSKYMEFIHWCVFFYKYTTTNILCIFIKV